MFDDDSTSLTRAMRYSLADALEEYLLDASMPALTPDEIAILRSGTTLWGRPTKATIALLVRIIRSTGLARTDAISN